SMVGEIEQRAVKLFRFSETTHRRSTDGLMAPIVQVAVTVDQQVSILPGGKETRCNTVDSDACLRKIYIQPLGEIRHRGLRSTVCRDFCQWRIRVHGRDIDDSRMLFRCHVAPKNLGRNQCAEEIELEHEIDAFGIELKEVLDVWVVDLVCIKVF